MTITELPPGAVAQGLLDRKIHLVDVREPAEFAAERIAGAENMPLSRFDPKAIVVPAGRELVLQCGIGKRSRMALEKCAEAGLPFHTHMQGGLASWKAAGLPTVR